MNSKPLIRLVVEHRKGGFIYILKDRNYVQCGRSAILYGSAQEAFDAGWLHLGMISPKELLLPRQISAPATVKLPDPLFTRDAS
jgi:hypothetical protein